MLDLYFHNQKTYEQVLDMFFNKNKVAVIKPTGTGKMYIALKWLYENRNKKCLYICPNKAVMYKFKKTIESNGLSLSDFPNLDLALYSNLLNWNTEDYNKVYDCIVLDEFNRTISSKVENCINKLLEHHKDSKILGLSNKKDTEEIFEGNIASEMNLEEAIAENILPFPNYVGCIYELEEEINKRYEILKNCPNDKKREYIENLLEQAKSQLENSLVIEDIINNHCKSGRYVIFCHDIENIYEMKDKVKSWFNKKKVTEYIVHSEIDNLENEKTINKLQNDTSEVQLLFTVDMFNDGYYPENIDGIIMIRKTNSHKMFLEQLERALTGETITLIDIANNIYAYENIYDLRDDVLKYLGYEGYLDKIPNGLKFGFKIHEYFKNIIGLLKQVDSAYRPILTFEEKIEIIKEYLSEGNSYSKIHKTLKYKSYPLGFWKNDFREKYEKGILTVDEIKTLTNLGAAFINEKAERLTFDEKVELLKEYITLKGITYKQIKINAKYKGYNIGRWPSQWQQKYNHDLLTKEEEITLNVLGASLKKGTVHIKFDAKIEIIKEYLKANGLLYKEIRGSDGNIGMWKTNFRTKYAQGKLSKKEEFILRSLGEDFDIKEASEKIPFLEKIRIIKEYLNISGTAYQDITGKTQYNGYNIGEWKARFRRKYVLSILDVNEEKMLRNLGETFEKEIKEGLTFLEKIEIIKEYLSIEGNNYHDIRIGTTYNGETIGFWKNEFRTKYNQGILTKEEELVLRSLGEVFKRERKEKLTFEEKINIIKEYLREGNTYQEIKTVTVYKNEKIGVWKSQFRTKYTNGELSILEEKILRSLGEDFQIKESNEKLRFEEKISIIKKYLSEGNTYQDIKTGTIYNNAKIGVWKIQFRMKYTNGELSVLEEEILRGLGEDFITNCKNAVYKMPSQIKLDKNSVVGDAKDIGKEKAKRK